MQLSPVAACVMLELVTFKALLKLHLQVLFVQGLIPTQAHLLSQPGKKGRCPKTTPHPVSDHSYPQVFKYKYEIQGRQNSPLHDTSLQLQSSGLHQTEGCSEIYHLRHKVIQFLFPSFSDCWGMGRLKSPLFAYHFMGISLDKHKRGTLRAGFPGTSSPTFVTSS